MELTKRSVTWRYVGRGADRKRFVAHGREVGEQVTGVRTAALDQMIEFAMEELLSGNAQRKRAMVRRMAERWPAEPALAMAYALTSATSSIEDSFGDAAANDPVIPLGYRLSALVSADIHAVQMMGQVPSVAEDLLHFWRRVDPLFLRLQ